MAPGQPRTGVRQQDGRVRLNPCSHSMSPAPTRCCNNLSKPGRKRSRNGWNACPSPARRTLPGNWSWPCMHSIVMRWARTNTTRWWHCTARWLRASRPVWNRSSPIPVCRPTPSKDKSAHSCANCKSNSASATSKSCWQWPTGASAAPAPNVRPKFPHGCCQPCATSRPPAT